jgi:hypothetical protein
MGRSLRRAVLFGQVVFYPLIDGLDVDVKAVVNDGDLGTRAPGAGLFCVV